MAVRLPDAVPLRTPRAAPGAPDAGAGLGDLGLGAAAQQLDQWGALHRQTQALADEQQAHEDRQAAETALLPFHEGAETSLRAQAAGPDAQKPGFAARYLGDLDGQRATFTASDTFKALTPGQQAAALHQLDQAKIAYGTRANQLEAVAQAQPIAERTAALKTAQVNDATTGALAAMTAAHGAWHAGDDIGQPGATARLDASLQPIVQAAVDSAPDAIKGEVQARLEGQRLSFVTGGAAQQAAAAEHALITSAETNADTTINAVTANPGGLGPALGQIDQLATTVPGAQRAEWARKQKARAVAAAVQSHLSNNDVGGADVLLKSRAAADFLEPEQLTALREHKDGVALNLTPKTADQALAQQNVEERAQAATVALATTGQTAADAPSWQEIARTKGVAAANAYTQQVALAQRAFNAVGPIASLTNDQLRALQERKPDPADPDYADKLMTFELQAKAAGTELDARMKDPAAAAMVSQRPGDAGDKVKQRFDAWLGAADPQARAKAAVSYAQGVLSVQELKGAAPSSWRVVSQPQAQAMVAQIVKAPLGEERSRAIAAAAATLNALPTSYVATHAGVTVHPQQMLASQLMAAGLKGPDLSAVMDLGSKPAALAAYSRAAADPDAIRKLPKAQEEQIGPAVDRAMGPFLQSAALQGGQADLNGARRNRVEIAARGLVLYSHMTPDQAAKAAASDLTDDYRYQGALRIPRTIADVPRAGQAGPSRGDTLSGGGTTQNTDWWIRRGGAQVVADLTAGGGSKLMATGDPAMGDANRRKLAASVVSRGAQWATNADETGAVLVAPDPHGGGWQPVLDSAGDRVSLTWDQLARRGQGAGQAYAPRASGDGGREALYRTIAAEAGNQGDQGILAAGSTAINRAHAAGRSLDQVVSSGAYEAYGNGLYRAAAPGTPAYERVKRVLEPVLNGQSNPLPYTHYYAPKLQAQLGRAAPGWDDGSGTAIGDHLFFTLPPGRR